MEKDPAFMQRLLATFKGEAAEHVHALSAGLFELEQAADPARRAELVETLFRETHSLKGAARAVGRGEMEALCQAAEGVLAALKDQRLAVAPPVVDLLHEAADTLEALLEAVDQGPDAALRGRVAGLRMTLAAAGEGGVAASPPPPQPAAQPLAEPAAAAAAAAAPPPEVPPPPLAPPATAPETVRIAVSRLDAVLFQAEGLLSTKLSAHQRQGELADAREAFVALRREWARSLPQARELHAAAKAFDARLAALAKAGDQGRRQLAGLVDGLLDDVKVLLMLPLSSALEVLPKVARDLCREQSKEAEFRVSGGEVEIDRRILEDIRDPLIHLVRNAIDHGIESPAAREAAGKPRRGTVSVTASPVAAGRIEIRVADDGAGVDLPRLAAAARQLGLAGEGAEAELLPLVFHSGISTSPLITDISGRGLGLAIVREKVERLGGEATVESVPGAGTAFRLNLPLTLATFHGVHVRAGGRDFIFPTMGMDRVARLPRQAVKTMENRRTVAIDGQPVALATLAEVLELNPAVAADANLAVVVAGSGERRIAFEVDEVVGELEVLAKGLGRQLVRVRNIGGATVLGSGRVVPILYVPDLLKSAARASGAARPAAAAAPRREARSVLVAEDSITSRMLLQGILEAAGYRVATAVDGQDAYTRLCTEPFDLLVSDVDMPRLNGFELTARIRADKRLSDLPVVLVTALESREHRERGAEVGANAYIVKSSFDQENLLAAVRRLV